MIQRGCGSRFLLETPQAVRVGGHELGQDLDCDFAVQPGIARAIDLAHTARPQGRANFILPENGSGSQFHAWGTVYRGRFVKRVDPDTTALLPSVDFGPINSWMVGHTEVI